MNNLYTIFKVAMENWQEALLGGIILTSAIIMMVGILKKFIFSKIQNKLVRKVVTAFSPVILVFPSTALYFLGTNINFDYYWVACGLVEVGTIVTYWLYENTLFRNVIATIGNNTIVKVFNALCKSFIKNDGKGVDDLIEVTTEIKNNAHNVLKENVQLNDDDELKNL